MIIYVVCVYIVFFISFFYTGSIKKFSDSGKSTTATYIRTLSDFCHLFTQKMSLWPFSVSPRDFSQPNASWNAEMQDVYDRYNALCEVNVEETEKRPWRKLPSYNRSLKYVTGV